MLGPVTGLPVSDDEHVFILRLDKRSGEPDERSRLQIEVLGTQVGARPGGGGIRDVGREGAACSAGEIGRAQEGRKLQESKKIQEVRPAQQEMRPDQEPHHLHKSNQLGACAPPPTPKSIFFLWA